MILICGIPSESPLSLVQEELDRIGVPKVIFNQRSFAEMEMEFEISRGRVSGHLKIHDRIYDLEDIHGVYIRLMDDQVLPELYGEPFNSQKRAYCRALHDTLLRWCEVASTRVVNRTGPMGSNFSKPYQMQLIRKHGFAVPETLITNDPDLVREFRDQHNRVIYKSISGVRSIVQTLNDDDLERLEKIRWCPTQFQEFVEGTNVRVHTINGEVFATKINSSATDYRYASHQVGDAAELVSIDLSAELAEKCISLSDSLGLAFAGIDLIISSDNRIYCLEVNTSPAYSYYEANTGQPISKAIALYLAGSG